MPAIAIVLLHPKSSSLPDADIDKLAAKKITHGRQCSIHVFTQLLILPICLRAVVRQLGRPALLAATYKGDAAGIAAAAMEEVGGTLINCLHELERLALVSGGLLFQTLHCLPSQAQLHFQMFVSPPP